MNSNHVGAGPNSPSPVLSSSEPNQVLQKVAQGAGLGGLITMGLTPGVYAKNMKMLGEPFVPKDCFRGIILLGINVVPQTAVQFVVNSLMMSVLYPSKGEQDLTFGQKLICSMVAGSASGLATVPGELVVQNYQKSRGTSMGQIVSKAYQAGGVRRFFQGGTALAARESIWASAYLTLSGKIADIYSRYFTDKHACDVLGAGTAGVVGGVLTSPPDLLKVQKQDQALSKGRARSYLQIAKSEGLKGMFRGSVVRCTVVALACIMMTEGRRLLNDRGRFDNE